MASSDVDDTANCDGCGFPVAPSVAPPVAPPMAPPVAPPVAPIAGACDPDRDHCVSEFLAPCIFSCINCSNMRSRTLDCLDRVASRSLWVPISLGVRTCARSSACVSD